MSDIDTDELLIYHGNAKPGDQSFADIVAIDSDIIDLLAGQPVSFSDHQFEMVLLAAAALPREQRDGFLKQSPGGCRPNRPTLKSGRPSMLLTDQQLAIVTEAAALLPPAARCNFLR